MMTEVVADRARPAMAASDGVGDMKAAKSRISSWRRKSGAFEGSDENDASRPLAELPLSLLLPDAL